MYKQAKAHEMNFVCQRISILFIALRIYNFDTNLKVFIHSFLKGCRHHMNIIEQVCENNTFRVEKNPNSNAINHH